MKTIGQKKPRSPEENIKRLEVLIREANRLFPSKKEMGAVYRFKTWDELYQFTITRTSRNL